MPRHYAEVHGYDKHFEASPEAASTGEGGLCEVCGLLFSDRNEKIRHLLRAHSKSSGEQCLYCTNRYFSDRLEEHIDNMHPEEKAKEV